MKTEDTRPEDYEFFKQYLEFVFFNEFGKRFEECLQSLAGRTKGHLSIGGRSLKEIIEDETCSEDIDSLIDHIKSKRPHLCAVFSNLDPLGASLLKTGILPKDVDFDAIACDVQRALELDHDEAARDSSKWASLEWKWERHN